ncbi:MAG: hypothetical protein PVI50_05265 [Gammaproteobacteria bacterium]|jgi:hypothetical protein
MKILRLSTYLLLGLMTTAALAGRPPGHYPERFPHAGTVDGIDLQQRTLIVSDMQQPLSAVVRVHDRSGGMGSLLQLREGMEIGYRTQSAGTRDGPISEIWILPNGYIAENRAKYRY